MQIQKVTLFTPDYKLYPNKKNNAAPEEHKSEPLQMFAYKDFNINFTGSDGSGRLFRTPANFYSTPFNRKGMPDTMKAYLNADYEDRQNMPPIQMWKTVFDDINIADNLEDVKILFPDEPLFENLKNNPNKARTSIISQIQTLQDDFKETPLFKDGKSDLGLYLLKKIYLEGKQIAEINKDFQKDINDEYRGLIDKKIDPATTAAYGIKFPNLAFWNSFVVTRDDFPYEYKPRKVSENKSVQQPRVKKERSLEDIRRDALDAERKRKFKPTDFEIRQLSDAVLDKKPEKALAKIRKRGGRNSENATFVEKYFSPIMSVALEKINASDEMRDFFQNPENMSQSNRERMQKYWREHPHFREFQSMAIKDTIKLFFEAYGADGNNEEFQDLLTYAASIKPARLEKQRLHDELQKEYEEALGIFEPEKSDATTVLSAVTEDIDEEDGDIAKYQKIFEDLKKEYNAESFDIDTPQGKVTIVGNLKEILKESIEYNCSFMPKPFVNKYIAFLMNDPDLTDEYLRSIILFSKGIDIPHTSSFRNEDDTLIKVTQEQWEFYRDFPVQSRAARQAIIDAVIPLAGEKNSVSLFRMLDTFELGDFFRSLSKPDQDIILKQSKSINEKYYSYMKPLSDYETHQIAKAIVRLAKKYDPKKSIIDEYSYHRDLKDVFYKLGQNISLDKSIEDRMFQGMKQYLSHYGGSARFFIDKKAPESLKLAKYEEFMCAYCQDEGDYKDNPIII